MSNWEFLSYEMTGSLTNYGGSKGIEIEWLRRMDKGDTSNNSALKFSSHTGTHIDFPLHFYVEGKTGSEYSASNFVFTKVGVLDISAADVHSYLISNRDLKNNLSSDLEFLIIKTGFCNRRNDTKYWEHNWGFAPETANFLKEKFPNLKAIGFDLISLSSYQQRETGRVAHKEFLEKNDILIVEDMDLQNIFGETKIKTLIVSPLRFEGADGAPVTILAEMS